MKARNLPTAQILVADLNKARERHKFLRDLLVTRKAQFGLEAEVRITIGGDTYGPSNTEY